MFKLGIFVFILIGLSVLASCESNFLQIEIRNDSADTLEVNYSESDWKDPQHSEPYFGIYHGAGIDSRNSAKYDSITKIHTFFMAPGRTWLLHHGMNEDLDHLSISTLCKHLEIIKNSDTVVSANYKETIAVFQRIEEQNGVKLELVVK